MWRSLRHCLWLAIFTAASHAAADVLQFTNVTAGHPVKLGTELRILCVGDSITVGYRSDQDGGDGNGYRLKLRDNLYKDNVTFAGSETDDGVMIGGYFAAWSGKTIQYMADHIRPSLEQRPNIVLIHAGTNDMNPNPSISTEGNDPNGAAQRLGSLIDQVLQACPDATILVAMIINTCVANQEPQTQVYQGLIPNVVQQRSDNGSHVLAANFTSFPNSSLHSDDCIHPTNAGYQLFGDYWYDFITQIPSDWINAPVGPDPNRTDGVYANGGLDNGIPSPDIGTSPVQVTPSENITSAVTVALQNGQASCNATPVWTATGEIFPGGVGSNGDWKYHTNWTESEKVAAGLGLDRHYVGLYDMDGDGKFDYVWLDPMTGEITCWLNRLPDPWIPAGSNGGIIGSGAGAENSVFIADMNGDGLADYMVVDPNSGSVSIWWNHGPDNSWDNGWKFVGGGQIASGVSHANWVTLRFADINGDGRSDYVYIGEGGAVKHFMNTGTVGGQDVLFAEQGGIFEGATSNISDIVFADLNGDGRDDYLIWDVDGGLTGFLNQPTQNEGVPQFIDQGGPKSLAEGDSQDPAFLRLADMDGDGKDDYVYIDENGGLWVSYNRGTGDTSLLMDGLRFADIDGDGQDDYVWLDPTTGAPTVYINNGPESSDSLGWSWKPLNISNPVGTDSVVASQVHFGDIDGDGKDDYIVLDPESGAVTAYLNLGSNRDTRWNSTGLIGTGLGPGVNVRFADIDGDGYDDYIYLHSNGSTTIYRNTYAPDTPSTDWKALPEADAAGIGQRAEEIDFYDINNDGKADYVWTSAVNGSIQVLFNNYPDQPTWLDQGIVAEGVGTSGSCIRYGVLLNSTYPDYIIVNPQNGTIAARLNSCDAQNIGPKAQKGQH